MKLKILLSICLLTNMLSASGQILYTDFVPDTTLTAPLLNTSYVLNIDINQDGTNDFRFSLYRWHQFASASCCDCDQQGVSSIDTNSKTGWIDTLYYGNGPCRNGTVDSGFVIDDTSLYWREGTQLRYACGSQFLYCYQTKFFIPVKLYLGGNYFFGWIRIVGATIYDMAVNLTPNQPITASQITTGIDDDMEQVFKASIYPIPFSDELKITLNHNELSEIILYDILSRKLLQKKFTNSISLRTEELEKGIYVYDVRSKSGLCQKGKVVKD